MRCARVIAKAHRPCRRPPGCVIDHKGSVRAVLFGSAGASLLETTGSRPGEYGRGGRSEARQPIVDVVFSPLARWAGEAYARRGDETGGTAIISDEGVRESGKGLRRHERGGLLPAFPPNSGTTEVAKEPR
jgi:hypothetical protein